MAARLPRHHPSLRLLALLPVVLATAGPNRPATAGGAGERNRPATAGGGASATTGWRFFEGSAEGDDLMPFVWLAVRGDTVYGSVAHRQRDIGFRLKGELRGKTVRLQAIYPLDGRRIGRFTGRLRAGSFRGEWTAVGRAGTWTATSVPVDAGAVQALAGAYFDPTPPDGIAALHVRLDPAAALARVEVDRGVGAVFAEGPWMADGQGRLWFMALRGDRTLGGLIPFDISVLKVPVAIPYRLRTTRADAVRLRLFNPVKPRQRVGTLEREPAPGRFSEFLLTSFSPPATISAGSP